MSYGLKRKQQLISLQRGHLAAQSVEHVTFGLGVMS